MACLDEIRGSIGLIGSGTLGVEEVTPLPATTVQPPTLAARAEVSPRLRRRAGPTDAKEGGPGRPFRSIPLGGRRLCGGAGQSKIGSQRAGVDPEMQAAAAPHMVVAQEPADRFLDFRAAIRARESNAVVVVGGRHSDRLVLGPTVLVTLDRDATSAS